MERLIAEHLLSEPNSAIGGKHLTIEIISDTSTVLHLTDHVPDGSPRDLHVRVRRLSHVVLNES